MGQKAVLGASWSDLYGTLLTCSADKYIRLYDPRLEDRSCIASFPNDCWVSDVSWSKEENHYFASAGYDQLIKIWDSRNSAQPVTSMHGHNGQVLCVDWSKKDYIVSGAVDHLVCIYRKK